MFQKSCYSGGVKHTWVMGIETKVVIPLFNSGMQGPVVATEAHREEVVLLCRVPEQCGQSCQKVGTAVPLKALNTRARAQKLVQKDVSCTFCSSTQGWDLSQESESESKHCLPPAARD